MGPFNLFLLFVLSASIFHVSLSDRSRPPSKKSIPSNGFGSSALFPVNGNVYPLGYYSVLLQIGNPPKVFELDIDTGSDLTWVECDAPCVKCTKPPEQLYKPKNNLVSCGDSLCKAVPDLARFPCDSPTDQCDYQIDYADQGSSLGVLVSDNIPLKLMNGSLVSPRIAFGCGYDQKNPTVPHPSSTSGVLGLGNGKVSVVSQLHDMGLTRSIVGHCFSRQGGGFLSIGDKFVPPSGITWTPMSQSSSESYYFVGPAELLFAGKASGIKGLQMVFDSGCSYTYFNSQVYKSFLDMIRKDLAGKPLKDAPEDGALSICWKGSKPLKSIQDVKSYFKPLALSFTKSKNIQMQLPAENYLIISERGNVCLGILNGTQVGLGSLNVIGDIFLQDKLVIYDNEKQQIGWASANCRRPANVEGDYDEGLCQPFPTTYGILEDICPFVYSSGRANKRN